MVEPLVSIIIPCWNAEPWIGEAVESALSQTYGSVETIVVDDGSTDRGLDVIRSFGSRIRWETGPRRGGAAARNRGMAMARGELIQFLDADDLLAPQKLELQVPSAVREQPGLVYCDEKAVSMATGELVRIHGPDIATEDPVVQLLGSGLAIEAVLHWKKVLGAMGGFREDLSCGQEFDLHLRLAAQGAAFRHLPEVLMTVRRRQDSVSHDYLRVLDQLPAILLPVHEALKQRGQLTEPRARAFATAMARGGRHCLQRGKKKQGLEYIRLARGMHGPGAADAYSGTQRLLYRTVGPAAAERMVSLRKRRLPRTRPVPRPGLQTSVPVFHLSHRYPHHARRSGQDRLTDYVGEAIPLSRGLRFLGDTVLWWPARYLAARHGGMAYGRRDFVMELQAALHMRRHRRSIYHVLYGEKSYGFLAAMAGRRDHAVIATFHQPPEAFAEYVPNTASLARLTAALAVSTNQIGFLEQFVGRGRVFFAPYGVDTDYFVPRAEPRAAGPPRLLCVGHHLRDFDALASVMSSVRRAHPDAELTLICFKHFVGELNLGPGVRWIRRAPDEEYLRHLQQSDLLVLPLRASTTVTAVLESLACGVPVVSNRGGIADYVDDASALLFDVGDVEGMAAGVLDLLADEGRRTRMAEGARRRAMSWSWPLVARQMRDLYERLAAAL